MSVYFQKVFYRKPYADIEMDRVLRKHFTVERIFINLGKFLSPQTHFNKDIKISLLKQEIFKRMELILVFVPFATMFAFEIHWFEFPEFPNHNSDPYIAALIFLEFCRVCVNYLIIYVSSWYFLKHHSYKSLNCGKIEGGITFSNLYGDVSSTSQTNSFAGSLQIWYPNSSTHFPFSQHFIWFSPQTWFPLYIHWSLHSLSPFVQ